MCNEINLFIYKCLERKEINLIDVYFSQIFKFGNFKSDVVVLFTMLISLSSRLGNTCLPICRLLYENIFSKYILDFLKYFFSRYISISNCIEILFEFNVLSKYYYYNKTPLILYNNCIYLYKFWVYEEFIVNFINLNFFKKKNFNIDKLFLFKFLSKFYLDIYQKISVLNVILNKISFISGGPGTGKTTLISKIILILYEIFKFKYSNCIKIISYTGKSASNITYSLKKNYDILNVSYSLKKKLPYKATTIHKFLGFNYNKNIFINDNTNTSILIIDEASMIDISLMYYLLSSLKYIKKIIFLGDSNQISSIDSSSLFNEICNFYINNFKIRNKILKRIFLNILNFKKKYYIYLSYISNISFLSKNYRFKKNIYLYKFINFVKLGYIKYIDKFLYKNNFKNNFNFYDSEKYNFNFLLNFCVKNYMKYINFIRFEFNLNKIWNIFNKFQIISVLKKTFYGVNFLNKYLNNYFLSNNLVKNILYISNLDCYHYLGEPIIITKNNNDLKLFNGDIGFFIFKKNKFKLMFLDYNKNNRFINYLNLTDWKNNWVITVHKSQGSEFKHILLVLPNYFSTLLNRELIYTAITRAKSKITIYANKNIFLSSINKKKNVFTNVLNKLLI